MWEKPTCGNQKIKNQKSKNFLVEPLVHSGCRRPPLWARCPASPLPALSWNYKDLHRSLFSHFSFILSFISPCHPIALSRITRVCVISPTPCCLAGFWPSSSIVVLELYMRQFCSWPLPSRSSYYISRSRPPLICPLSCPLSPTARVSDKNKPSYSSSRILSPAQQLSSQQR